MWLGMPFYWLFKYSTVVSNSLRPAITDGSAFFAICLLAQCWETAELVGSDSGEVVVIFFFLCAYLEV